MTAVGALASLLVCRTVPVQPDVPAVIVNPTEQSRASLKKAVSAALGVAPVILADDALTRTSALIIERARQRDQGGLPLNGREPGMPDQFRLLKRGADCVQQQEGTGRRFTLAATECSPL